MPIEYIMYFFLYRRVNQYSEQENNNNKVLQDINKASGNSRSSMLGTK